MSPLRTLAIVTRSLPTIVIHLQGARGVVKFFLSSVVAREKGWANAIETVPLVPFALIGAPCEVDRHLDSVDGNAQLDVANTPSSYRQVEYCTPEHPRISSLDT